MNKQFTNASPLAWAAPGTFFLASMALVPLPRIMPECLSSESAGASLAVKDSWETEEGVVKPPDEIIGVVSGLDLECSYLLGRGGFFSIENIRRLMQNEPYIAFVVVLTQMAMVLVIA